MVRFNTLNLKGKSQTHLVHLSFPLFKSPLRNSNAGSYFLSLHFLLLTLTAGCSATWQSNVALDPWQLASGRVQRWCASTYWPSELGPGRAQGKGAGLGNYTSIGLYCQLFGWVVIEAFTWGFSIFDNYVSRHGRNNWSVLTEGWPQRQTVLWIHVFLVFVHLSYRRSLLFWLEFG